MSIVPTLRLCLSAGLIGSSLTLTACGEPPPEQLLASAKRELAAQDHKAAVIHLKAALQQQGDLPEARYLLGKVLLERGDPGSAVIELRKALDAKHPSKDVMPLLAKALVRQGHFKKATDEFGALVLGDPQAAADLKATLAHAYLAQGSQEAAQKALGDALAAVPDHVPSLLLQTKQHWAKGDRDAATALMQRALAKAPEDEDALILQADLLLSQGQPDRALETYRRALVAHPVSLVAHVGLLNVLVAGSDLRASEEALGAMQKHHPGHWTRAYFSARLSAQKGDTKKANETAQQLLKVLPDEPPVLQLAGALALQSRSLLKAEQLLVKALNAAPQSDVTRRFLIQTYLGTGEASKALAVAEPLLDGSPTHHDLSLVALAYILNGETKRAEQLYRRASVIEPTNARTQTALAMTRLSEGKSSALADLASISSWDTGLTADLALIRAHLARKEHDAALKAVDNLERKHPGMALNSHLRGLVLQGKGDILAARASYEAALQSDPGFFPAAAKLALLDLKEKSAEHAQQRIEKFLKTKPSHSGALVALAQLHAAVPGQGDNVAKLLNRAVRDNPNDVAPRLVLIRHELSRGQPKSAVAAAQAAAAALPDRPDIIEALGQSQLAAGDFQQALSSFGRLAALRPASARPQLDLAQTYLRMNDRPAALRSAQRALAISPTLVLAQDLVARLMLADRRFDEARAIAKAVQKQRPDSAAGFSLEGDIEAASKKVQEAEAAYRSALTKKDAGTSEAIKLHGLLLEQGDSGRADALANSWLQQHPADLAFVSSLATTAFLRRDYATAAARFSEVLKARPDDPIVLNNLAFVTLKLKRPGALAMVERADQLKPDFPPILRTYAEVLAAEKKLDKAIELQRRAVSLQPDDAYQHLALARLYLAAGDRAGARKEMEQIDAMDKSVAARQALAQLQKRLN